MAVGPEPANRHEPVSEALFKRQSESESFSHHVPSHVRVPCTSRDTIFAGRKPRSSSPASSAASAAAASKRHVSHPARMPPAAASPARPRPRPRTLGTPLTGWPPPSPARGGYTVTDRSVRPAARGTAGGRGGTCWPLSVLSDKLVMTRLSDDST